VFGREIPQVLLIHANEINAECLDALLARLSARGDRFVTLEDATKDEACKTEDRFVGTFGPSWLHRWGIARGVPVSMRDEPDPPAWVMDAYNGR
jgi:peptidoglycan-N-acetylglucosamine deacetylase